MKQMDRLWRGTWEAFRRVVLCGCGVMAMAAIAVAGEGGSLAALPMELTPDWQLTRVSKDSKKKVNAYEGRIGLRNTGKKTAENTTVRIVLYAANGGMVTEMEPLAVGAIAPGKSVEKPFAIPDGLPFAELRVTVQADADGAKAQAEFSSPDGTRPVSHAASPHGLAVLSRTFNKQPQKLSARLNDPIVVMLSFRVKNVNPSEVKELGVRATFTAGKKEKVVEVALAGKGLNPGEVRGYEGVRLEGVPPTYTNCTLEVTGDAVAAIPAKPGTDSAPAASGADQGSVGDEALQIGPLKIVADRQVVAFALTSRDCDVPAGKMNVELHLTDAAGTEVKVVRKVLPQAFVKGQQMNVEISTAGEPAFTSCEVGVGYEFDAPADAK